MFVILQKLWGYFLRLMGFPAQKYICFRPYVLPVVVGLCLGITIHMMFAPFLEEGCDLAAVRSAARSSKDVNSYSTKNSDAGKLHTGVDDFEARIIKPSPNNTNVNKNDARPKVARPRYISTELGIREKLFVAVLTSASSVSKLGVAVDKTLSKHVTKVIFFSSEKPKVIPTGLPMVAFGDSRPQVLPIHILRYIKEHFAESYDFYLFISDRTYLRAEKYYQMVEHISVSEDVYMGVPGLDRNFCSLEGGVLLSQSIMVDVLSSLDGCVGETHPDNPSITLGRCVHQASQKSCTQRTSERALNYYQLQDFVYDGDINQLKMESSFNQSLTLYPMPDDISYYKLHRYFCYVDLNDTQHEIEAAKEDIIQLSKHSPGGQDSLTWPLGAEPPYKPANRYFVIQWTYFTETHLFLDNELTNMKEIVGADKLDIDDIKRVAMENLDRKYHSQFQLRKLLNGYRRFDSTRGMEYILDLLLVDKHHQNTETVKRVHLVRPLGKVELVPMPYVTENMMVNIILPLQPSDIAMFDVFMDSYARTCLQNTEDVRLIVAMVYPHISHSSEMGKDLFGRPKSVIAEYNKKYDTKGKLSWKALDNAITDISVIDELQNEFKTEVLVLVTSVNVEMSPDAFTQYLNRVRMNTIKGKQVFFPMGFWQFKPNLTYNKKPFPSSVEVGQRLGQFNTKSFEHASFYLSDYKTARKTLSPAAVKTGDIFNMFLSYKEFHVFRAVEPNLKLRWMNLTCDPRVTEEKYHTCLTRNVEGLASQHHLALLIYEQNHEAISQSANQQGAAARAVQRAKPVPVVPQEADIIEPPEPLMLKPQQVNEINVNNLPADPQAEGMIVMDQQHKKKV